MIASDWKRQSNSEIDPTKKPKETRIQQTTLHELKHKHLHEINQGTNWIDVWEMFVNHKDFDRILEIAVNKCIRNFRLPSEWKDDLRQETLIYFSRHLQKSTTLGFDESKGTYEGWLYIILFGSCRKATRQFKDSQRQKCDPFDRFSSDSWTRQVELQMDLMDLLDSIDPQQKAFFLSYWHGTSVAEIARKSGTGERKVYRVLKKAIEKVNELTRTD